MLAPPGIVVAEGLAGVSGLECKIILDATNRLASQTPAPDGYDSIAEYVNATTGGSVAKVFNLIYGAILDQAAGTARRPRQPGNLWVRDEGARDAVEQLGAEIGWRPSTEGP